MTLWPVFGVADQILAVLGFTLLALVLRQLQRPLAVVILPLIFLLAVSNWALVEQMMQWWAADDWILLALGTILVLMELRVALLTFNALKASPPPTA